MAFEFPFFYNYPPYFTVQPIKETADKQAALWCQLILQYSKHQKAFILSTGADDDHPLFVNKSIERRLGHEARVLYLEKLVTAGKAAWLDKEKTRCLILWRTIPEWSDYIQSWVQEYGLQDSVFDLAELSVGDEVRGTELEGVPAEVLVPALKILSQRGRARLFKNPSGEQGVKFLAGT